MNPNDVENLNLVPVSNHRALSSWEGFLLLLEQSWLLANASINYSIYLQWTSAAIVRLDSSGSKCITCCIIHRLLIGAFFDGKTCFCLGCIWFFYRVTMFEQRSCETITIWSIYKIYEDNNNKKKKYILYSRQYIH